MDKPLMKQLYTSLVRTHLEFGNVIWNPCLKGEIDLMERVQHRTTRMIPGLAKQDYEARLEKKSQRRRHRNVQLPAWIIHGWLFTYASTSQNRLSYYQRTQSQTTKKETAGHSFECIRLEPTARRNCSGFLGQPLQGTLMTGTKSIYVSRTDTSSRSIYRPHCLEYDDDDDDDDDDC